MSEILEELISKVKISASNTVPTITGDLIQDYSQSKRYIKLKNPGDCIVGDIWKNLENARVYLITKKIKDKLYCKIMRRKNRNSNINLPNEILLLGMIMEESNVTKT